MNSLVTVLENKKNVYHKAGVDEKVLIDAETSLGLHFSNDYKEYLSNFGLISYESHELTGICESPRLNVVEATKREKAENEYLTEDMYLLEQLGVENLSIWQNTNGEIFEVPYKGKPRKIFDSLIEYIEKF